MKEIIDFTKNWKNRNTLHLIGGILIALLPNIILPKFLGFIVGIIVTLYIGHKWELAQVKYYNAIYTKKDVLLTVLGGFIVGLLFLIL